MSTDSFRTSDGYRLWRITTELGHVWRDKPAGDDNWDMEFGDKDGHPVDDLGDPLDGKFGES